MARSLPRRNAWCWSIPTQVSGWCRRYPL
jgi:hypothetical protein